MRVTRDDERARRICALALAFMSSPAPVSSTDVAERFYPDLSADSFRRSFSRDRSLLAACGVHVAARGRRGGQTLWAADERRSFAGELHVSPSDAAALEVACQPLLDDPEFPLAQDLRYALAKLTRTFAFPTPPRSGSRPEDPAALPVLRDALVRGRAVEMTYTTASGRTSPRRVSPYGIFAIGGASYLVAAKLDETGAPVEGETRTWRVDRASGARVLEDVEVLVPGDFSLADWRRLPFQLGAPVATCTFRVPGDRERDLRRETRGAGELREDGGRLLWTVGAADLPAAAAWAVAMGVEPVEPPELVSAWRGTLEGVLRDGAR